MNGSDRIVELFAAASELPEEEQTPFLNRECAGHPALRAELELLLEANRRSQEDSFLRQPAPVTGSTTGGRDPQPSGRSGQTFGRYRIVRLLGSGGMGEVYLAEDTGLDRQVALKVIKRALNTDELLDRFDRERQILAHLNHENIARLLDVGTAADGNPFLVMEYVDGKPLDEYCDSGALSISARLTLFRTICSAVGYAHQNLVVHRDLKPSNILVTAEGHVKLLDFGIAKLIDINLHGGAEAKTLLTALTPAYASPEQIRGDSTTTATDIYSLGVVLYELLTRRGPYQLKRRTAHEIARAVCEQDPQRPSTAVQTSDEPGSGAVPAAQPAIEGSVDAWRRRLRGDLDHIVLKALRKEARERYATADQFSEDIRRHGSGLPVTARRATFSYCAAKFIRRNRIAAGAAVALLGGTAVAAWSAHVAVMQRAAANSSLNEIRTLAHSVLFEYHDAIATLPGSTAVRGKLVAGALAYLDRTAKDSGSDAGVQLELAAAYIRAGDVQGRPYSSNLGQTAGALLSYGKGLVILDPILTRLPENIEARRLAATAQERIGNIELRKSRFAEAAVRQQKALSIRERLVALNPADAGSRGDLAASYLYLGDAIQVQCSALADGANCERAALETQRKGLAMRQELLRERPADTQLMRDVAQGHMRVGFRLRDLAKWTGDHSLFLQSLENQSSGLEIRERVAAANPSNAKDRRDWADQVMMLSEVHALLGDHRSALAGYRRSLSTFQALSAADPANAEARRDLSFNYQKMALELETTGQRAASQKNYDNSLACALQLLAGDPASEEDRRTVYYLFREMSALAAKSGQSQRAMEYEAIEYYHVGRLNLDTASAAGNQDAGLVESWRNGKDAYGRSIAAFQKLQLAGPLSRSDLDILQQATRELALCDAALARARR